jgi:transcriptional repressor of cell division inhibition gene dicB
MKKTDVLEHFGSQQKVADALTAAGFPITQTGVSAWPDVVPLQKALPLAQLMGRELDLSLYRNRQPAQ